MQSIYKVLLIKHHTKQSLDHLIGDERLSTLSKAVLLWWCVE